MAIFNGSELIVTLAADGGSQLKLLHSTSCTLSINADTIDTSTKDSGGWRDIYEIKQSKIAEDQKQSPCT